MNVPLSAILVSTNETLKLHMKQSIQHNFFSYFAIAGFSGNQAEQQHIKLFLSILSPSPFLLIKMICIGFSLLRCCCCNINHTSWCYQDQTVDLRDLLKVNKIHILFHFFAVEFLCYFLLILSLSKPGGLLHKQSINLNRFINFNGLINGWNIDKLILISISQKEINRQFYFCFFFKNIDTVVNVRLLKAEELS